MIIARLLLCITAAVTLAGPAVGAEIVDRFPGAEWDHADPAQAGWSTDMLAKAKAFSQAIGSSAVMIIQHGVVVAEWGDTQKPMELASVRKSLLSALIGNAVARKQISLEARIGELGIDDNAPSLTPEEKTATVEELLEARSGVYHPALYETAEMAARRPVRGSHPPGTFWYYNNWDFNALGAIYLQRTGSSVFDALDRKIAKPIGMQDYRTEDGVYFTGPDSVYPAYTIRMSARDLARFALLYLRDGKWKDRQLVPADWVHRSTQPYSHDARGVGYGYLWWTGFFDPARPTTPVRLPEGSFFADGAAGQYAFVIPAADIVVVHRVDRDVKGYRPVNLQQAGRLLWLILAAARQPDIGPDTSLEAATGTRLDEAALARLSGTTLVADGEPHLRFRILAGGQYQVLSGLASDATSGGSWAIRGGKFCSTIGPRKDERCFAVMADGSHLRFFNRDGLLAYEFEESSGAQ